MAPASAPAPQIRRALRADIGEIASMIQELADYEHEPASNHATPALLLETINFADEPKQSVSPGEPLSSGTPNRKVAHVFLATVPRSAADGASERGASGQQEDDEVVAGMALFFYNYSTWRATPGVYLEDLFVRPAFRRQGIARLVFAALAEETARISGGRGRLEWSCLRWNEDALGFYDRIGGVRMEGWVGIRVEGEGKLKELSEVKKG